MWGAAHPERCQNEDAMLVWLGCHGFRVGCADWQCACCSNSCVNSVRPMSSGNEHGIFPAT